MTHNIPKPYTFLRAQNHKVQKSSFSSKYAKVSDAGREARTDFQVVEVYEDDKPGLSGVEHILWEVDNLYHLDA